MVCEPPDGGTAEMVAALATGLGAHGYDVEVAVSDGAVRFDSLPVTVHRLPLRPGYGALRDDAAAVWGLARLVRRRRPDLVHTHSAKAGALGRPVAAALRVPVVHSPHCFPFLSRRHGRAGQAFSQGVERALARLTRTVICVCEDEREEALAHGIGPDSRLAVIPNGVPACMSAPVAAPLAELGRPVAATIAVLRDQKRPDVFVDAAPEVLRRLPDARLAVIGNGALREELEAQAARLGLLGDGRFAFIPYAPPMAQWLAGIDCFVLPSDYEGLPVAILEALACGVPQVATDVGGTGEAVTPESGVLVPPGDPAALADAMVGVLGDPQRRARMSAASVARHAERFGEQRMIAAHAAVYDEILKPSR